MPTAIVSAADAARSFSALLERVRRERVAVEIEQGGHIMARLEPVATPEGPTGSQLGGGFNGLITLVARAFVQCRQARAPLAERSRSQRRPSRWSVRFDSAQRTVGWMDRPAGLGRPIIPTHLPQLDRLLAESAFPHLGADEAAAFEADIVAVLAKQA